MKCCTDLKPADQAYSEEEVKGMFDDGARMPWATDASNVEALQRYHGHHIHLASEDLLRLQVHDYYFCLLSSVQSSIN